MKNILGIFWNFLKQKNHMLIAIIIAIILILSAIVYFQHNRIANLKDKYQTEVKLKDALIDTVKIYQNQRDEWVSEKLTMQENIKNLKEIYEKLSDSQKELIDRVKELNKKNTIIAAALIETNAHIDSLKHELLDGAETIIDTTKKKINFNNLKTQDSTFRYDIDVLHVLPAHLDINPDLLFKSIELPNKQFIEFHWKNEKKKGYPISFSVSNSNKYIKTINVESYAIPSLDKLNINPNGWQKFGNFFIKNGKTVLYIGMGGAIGAGTVYLLMK